MLKKKQHIKVYLHNLKDSKKVSVKVREHHTPRHSHHTLMI